MFVSKLDQNYLALPKFIAWRAWTPWSWLHSSVSCHTCQFLLHWTFGKNIFCLKLQKKLRCHRIKARRIPDETILLTFIVDFWSNSITGWPIAIIELLKQKVFRYLSTLQHRSTVKIAIKIFTNKGKKLPVYWMQFVEISKISKLVCRINAPVGLEKKTNIRAKVSENSFRNSSDHCNSALNVCIAPLKIFRLHTQMLSPSKDLVVKEKVSVHAVFTE